MRVLAAVVIPPHLGQSGAVNAALALSRHLGALEDTELDVALMSSETSHAAIGAARLLRRRAETPFWPVSRKLPNRVRTLFYRSDIPTLATAGYDIVHLHNPTPALEMRRIARAALRAGVPYVVSTHGFVEALDFGAAMALPPAVRVLVEPLVRRPLVDVIERASMVFALSSVDAGLVTDLGYPDEQVVLVPNGIDRRLLEPPDEAAIRSVCARFGLSPTPDAPRCFFLANHTANKGLDVLMAAAAHTDRPFELIVGGARRDLPYERWQAEARPGQRIIVTDRLEDDEIRALHHLAELFVFPSRADTLPLVVLEAMASGTPVLSTTVGGIPSQVVDGCGWLVPPGDADALRVAWERALDARGSLAEMGVAARRHVEATFDWARSARIARDGYDSVVQAARKARSVDRPGR